ncbi:MAG TPA: hypothetical protein VJT50_13510, partial [Pyrinomonadaceae bacterium]|nr:hypothetical protein [Pyrinomonadaceae bacterium]
HPTFLAEQATGEPLSDSDQSAFKEFLARTRTGAVVTELNDKDSAEPFVGLKVPAPPQPGMPVIFDVTIQHK